MSQKSEYMPSSIVMFVYNRPEHTRRTIEALLKNKLSIESDLIIYSDASKNEKAEEGVRKVRDYIQNIHGFKSLKIIQRTENFGLAKSILEGVTETVAGTGRVIVMEDDLETGPYFLKYMNDALDFYENEERVISIHGYIYPVRSELPETFFLRGADCWGWATWKRGWDLIETDGKKLLAQIQNRHLESEFDYSGYSYTQMLQDQIEGKNNSWAVRWHASAFLLNKLTLYPGKSMVRNIGNDASGTHSAMDDHFNTEIYQHPISIKAIPLEECEEAKTAITRFYKITQHPGVFRKVLNRLKRILKSL